MYFVSLNWSIESLWFRWLRVSLWYVAVVIASVKFHIIRMTWWCSARDALTGEFLSLFLHLWGVSSSGSFSVFFFCFKAFWVCLLRLFLELCKVKWSWLGLASVCLQVSMIYPFVLEHWKDLSPYPKFGSFWETYKLDSNMISM